MNKEMEKEYFELERQLKDIKASGMSSEDKWKKIFNLHKERVKLLPKVTFAKGKPYAEVIQNPYLWDVGAPLPNVIYNGYNTYLAYTLPEGLNLPKDKIVILREDYGAYDCALLKFEKILDYRFGGANDEVLSNHSMQGLDFYELHLVYNSGWISDLHRINAYHSNYDPLYWEDLKHFFLTERISNPQIFHKFYYPRVG